MEEDTAFSSMAQDKIGHAWALYRVLHEALGGSDPDRFAFLGNETEYKCCHLTEMPNGEYDFSLMRHFLFDLRKRCVMKPCSEQLRAIAAYWQKNKRRDQVSYTARERMDHGSFALPEKRVMRACSLRLTNASLWHWDFFEPQEGEEELIAANVYPGEKALQQKWTGTYIPCFAARGSRTAGSKNNRPCFWRQERIPYASTRNRCWKRWVRYSARIQRLSGRQHERKKTYIKH